MQKQIRIPAEMLVLYRKSLQLIVLLGSFLQRPERSFRFEQLEGLEEEEPGGNKETPLYFAELNTVLPIERKISPCLPLVLPLQGSCENAIHNGVIKQKP